MRVQVQASIDTATPTHDGIEILWSDGATQPLDRFWLRDNCPCPACLHGDTLERTFDILDAPETLRVAEVEATPEGALRIVWQPGGHMSVYPLPWLAGFRQDAGGAGDLGVATWEGADMTSPPVFNHGLYMTSDAALAGWLRQLLEKGVALLTAAPRREGAILETARRIGPPRDTNFGLIFDVKSKPNPNNSAYTALGLAAHVDLPNWERPPDFQLLYCLQNAAAGGDSFLVDGFRVAEVLRRDSPEDFFVLSETPVDFRFHDDSQDIAHRAPVIGLDSTGRLRDIRFNMWIMDAVRLSETQMTAFYRAYRRFATLLREPRFELRLRLEAGQMLAFDNRRILHGRTAFDPNSGPRHLQGAYLDRDLVLSRLRVLERAR